MIDAAASASVYLIVGPQPQLRSPDPAHARDRRKAEPSAQCRMISAQYYTDFLYRPRRPEELATATRRRRDLQPGARIRSTSSGCWAAGRS